MLSKEILELIQRAIAEQDLGAGQHTLQFSARSVPFSTPLGVQAREAARSAPAVRASAEDEAGDGAEEADDAGTEEPTSEMTTFRMSGTASSTSVDWYGTEMSRPCLDDMAVQFEAGVEVFVGHGGWANPLEWDKAIGITDAAEVKAATVAEPADPKEKGAVLTVEMVFAYNDETPTDLRDAIRLLRQRVQRGLPTGLSIGGWFRRVTYITGEDGELLRIIIEKVDLDHLATTRRPANPDCLDMAVMRSVIHDALTAFRSASSPSPARSDSPARSEVPPTAAPQLETSPPDTRSDPESCVKALHIQAPEEPPTAWAKVVASPAESVPLPPETRAAPEPVVEAPVQTPDPIPDPEPAQREAPPVAPVPDPAPSQTLEVPPSATRSAPAHDQEFDMTPEQLQALLNDAVNRALAAAGVGTAPAAPVETPTAQRELADADQRRGQLQTPTPAVPQAPTGADLARARSLVDGVILRNRSGHAPDSIVAEFKGEILRGFHFGEDHVPHARAISYREPSGQRQKAMWLGVGHQLRGMGVTGVADVIERSAEVLGLEIRGIRGLRTEATADKERVDTDARALIADTIRAAVAEGHPTFREPGTREAATRALTVSAASDKVTTALVSALLQQLSNVQLGARTQLRRIPGAGTQYATPKRTVSSTLAEFVADGTAPTEDSGTWGQDTWAYKTLATRVKVTRKAQAQGAQWGDLVSSEMLYKAEDFNRQEEVAIFQGDSANSLPTANAFNGLITLIGVNSGQTVANTTATAGDVISLIKLDETIDKVRGRENKGNLRIFASEKGHRLLNTVLQADQQFNNVVMVAAGFIVQTYQGIPIVQSSGLPDACVWNGTDARVTKVSTGATTAIVVANLTHVYLVVLTPVTMSEVAVTTAQYTEWEMYCDETLVLDNFYGAAMLGGIKTS